MFYYGMCYAYTMYDVRSITYPGRNTTESTIK